MSKTTMPNVDLSVDYVSRVEGHGNIVVTAQGGEVSEVRFDVTEPPRFFEGMLKGRPYTEAPLITSRICGICSNGHTLASITGVENALGVTPSEQTMLLRRLLMHGETIQSHVLHAYFLVAPDFLGVDSVIPLAATHPDVVKRALRLKKLGNDLCDVIGGRAVHQIAATVGGFTHYPSVDELLDMRTRLKDSLADLAATAELFATLDMPAFDHPTEYLSLKAAGSYAFFGDLILSSNGDITPVRHYREKVKERVVPHSSAKHCRSDQETFMVGALARANNGFKNLSDGAVAVADQLGFAPVCTNTFMNTVAQLVETVHCVEDSIVLIDTLLGSRDTHRDHRRRGQGRARRGRSRGAPGHAVPRVRHRPRRPHRRRQPDHPHRAEPRQPRAGHVGPRADRARQGQGGGPEESRDAGARLRPVHLVLDPPDRLG